MARNYAALPHEYLTEMAELSDAEFGRLCRALLKYSMTGEETTLQGAERLLLRRVYMQERRYQDSYNETIQKRSKAGKMGATKRWGNTNSNAIENDSIAIKTDGKAIPDYGNAMEVHGKNGQTETETETNSLLSDDSKREYRARPREGYPSAEDVRRFALQIGGTELAASSWYGMCQSLGWKTPAGEIVTPHNWKDIAYRYIDEGLI